MKVEMLGHPDGMDWTEVKRRALVTAGKTSFAPPTIAWERKILRARHSPIRYLRFSFYIECPYWASVHLARHVHAQPYIKSQRNDRQSEYDRNEAPQNATVCMIYDLNAEALMTFMNKRLCNKASKETRELARMMRDAVLDKCPEFDGLLVPACVENGGVCKEMDPCGGITK